MIDSRPGRLIPSYYQLTKYVLMAIEIWLARQTVDLVLDSWKSFTCNARLEINSCHGVELHWEISREDLEFTWSSGCLPC